MAWDDIKSEGDDITPEEWNNHVADQLSAGDGGAIVQDDEPPVGESGDVWARPGVNGGSISTNSRHDIAHGDGGDLALDYDEARDVVYYIRDDGDMVAADPVTLDVIWERSMDGGVYNLAYSFQTDQIAATYYTNTEFVDAETGDTVWYADPDDYQELVSSYTRNDGWRNFMVASQTGTDVEVTQYNIDDQEENRTATISKNVQCIDSDEDLISGDPHVLIGMNDGSISSYDGLWFDYNWNENVHDDRVNSISVDSGAAVSGGSDNAVIYFSHTDGLEVFWEHTQHTDRVRGVYLDDTYVYSVDRDGIVLVTERATGTVVSQSSVKETMGGKIKRTGSLVYVGTTNDNRMKAYDLERTAETYISDGELWRVVK